GVSGRLNLGGILSDQNTFDITGWFNPTAVLSSDTVVFGNQSLLSGFSIRQDSDSAGKLKLEVVSTYDQIVTSLSPTAYFRFEETSGSIVSDSSGHDRHGTYGGVIFQEAGAAAIGGFSAKTD